MVAVSVRSRTHSVDRFSSGTFRLISSSRLPSCANGNPSRRRRMNSGCGLLLDVNKVYVSSRDDPRVFLAHIPRNRCGGCTSLVIP
jgi:hypothetical protein